MLRVAHTTTHGAKHSLSGAAANAATFFCTLWPHSLMRLQQRCMPRCTMPLFSEKGAARANVASHCASEADGNA